MLYDNAQFILLLSKYLKTKKNEYYEKKIFQTIEFINKNFLHPENKLLGSAYDADSEGEEGKYYVFSYDELKNIKNINQYYDIKPEGNWENKIILKEIKTPTESVTLDLKKIREKKIKPFFDNKVQLDLNCLWVSSLISAEQILPNNNFLKIAEAYYKNLEIFFFNKEQLQHTILKPDVFLEDYAYSIAMLLDLYEHTLKPNYLLKAKELCRKTYELFYVKEKSIFQKNIVATNELFHKPIDISDGNIPNGNSIMLLNYSRLKMNNEAKVLSNSLNGYLNFYKPIMASSLKAIDFFKMNESGKSCNENGCLT